MRFATGCVVDRFMRMLDSLEEMVDVMANGVRLGFDKHKKETFRIFCNIYITCVFQIVFLIHCSNIGMSRPTNTPRMI